MDITACVELIERMGWTMLVILGLTGVYGVALNIWWSNKLDPTKKDDYKRLLFPLCHVAALSILILIIFVIIFPDLRKCLENPEIPSYLPSIFLYTFPVVGTGIPISIIVCAIIRNYCLYCNCFYCLDNCILAR